MTNIEKLKEKIEELKKEGFIGFSYTNYDRLLGKIPYDAEAEAEAALKMIEAWQNGETTPIYETNLPA